MAEGGIEDILVANEIIETHKLETLADVARESRVTVAVDSLEGVDGLSRAASRAGVEFGVLLDVDVGLGRGGVRNTETARSVAAAAFRAPNLALRGTMGYEGHAVLEPDRGRREELVSEAMERLTAVTSLLAQEGYTMEIVSAGGTNTYDLTGAVPAVSELQAGTYALMDSSYTTFVPSFVPALSVIGRVISRHGDRVVIDCGLKVTGISELNAPSPKAASLAFRELHEEHTLLDVVEGDGPTVGDVVEMTVGYAGGAVNSNDFYTVVEDRRIVDIWPIVGRGAGGAPGPA
jgi:D-serine deaminase-like pyridoxal phosphate-dependent protein